MAKVTLLKPEPTHVQIANRAFEIYISRGGEHGHDVGDWFEAERQLRPNFSLRSGWSSESRRKARSLPLRPARVNGVGEAAISVDPLRLEKVLVLDEDEGWVPE
jgi:hypothetical protein